MHTRSLGFTLIELLVAVAIVAILAAVAAGSYQDHINTSKRAAAKGVLVEAANWLERRYSSSGCYNFGVTAHCAAQAGASATVLPDALNSSPREGATESYSVSVAFANSGQTYTLSATPCGNGGCTAGSNDGFTDGKCNVLSLDSLGTQGETGSGSVADCWQR